MLKRLAFAFVLVLLVGVAVPAGANPQGHIAVEDGVGYFYGTFNAEGPNVQLLVGGTAEDFCLDNPEDPFNGEPGSALHRIFLRHDGSVDVKVNDKDQPIHLYRSGAIDGPSWISGVCDGEIDPVLFASGTGDLKVRVSESESGDRVEIFNSVNGIASGDDATYKIRASADFVVVNGELQSDPEDFVSFSMTEIRR